MQAPLERVDEPLALRQREFSVRRALGASRFRLVRQLVTESLVLAIGAGVCGVIMAMWTTRLIEVSLPAVFGTFALHLDLSLDWYTIIFVTIVSLVATVLCGLLPAWQTSAARGLAAFKNEIRGGTPARRPIGLVAQVVISLVLLFVAGTFLQALLRLQASDPGFAVARRLYAQAFIPSPSLTPESRRELYAQARDRVQALPGVRRAALTSSLPLMPGGSECASRPAGPQVPISAGGVDVGFFETMGINLIAGRDFATNDLSADAVTVVVNESLARRLWSGSSAVGERVMVGCDAPHPAIVVGVVRDSAIRTVGETAQPHLYRPFGPQYSGGLTTIVVETETDPTGMVQPVRRTLLGLGLGQGIRIYAVQPLSTHVEQSYAQARWTATALTGFAVLALLVAAIGLYGVIAYRVGLRTQEIGVRMAFGATRVDIFREVLGHGLVVVLVGIAIGELLTAAMTGVVGSVQEGIHLTGLSTHVTIGVIWIAVAIVACYVPATRAARLDPLVALRYE